ncbi:triosephosphate isomerase [Holotrichia oblita]|nr:triosephosphate isomerase [Holotrichia oblita]
MHKTGQEGRELVKALHALTANVKDVEIVVCPPFTALAQVGEAVLGTNIKLGAQNVYFEAKGAFTGEISTDMLKALNCDYVIIGHSERRQYFGETDESVNKKTKAALKAGLIPIVCVGETLTEREQGITEKIVEKQVRGGLSELSPAEASGLVIAYEPVWAIGTGRTASADDADAVCAFIRKILSDMFGTESANKIRIQYGGSVKPDNVSELMGKQDIDGALVGGASLEAETFSKLVLYK